MRILVTGGAGYIGSHTAKAMAQAGLEPIEAPSLSYLLKELLSLGLGKIINQLTEGWKRGVPVAVLQVQIRPGQEVCTDHLKAVAAGFVAS